MHITKISPKVNVMFSSIHSSDT